MNTAIALTILFIAVAADSDTVDTCEVFSEFVPEPIVVEDISTPLPDHAETTVLIDDIGKLRSLHFVGFHPEGTGSLPLKNQISQRLKEQFFCPPEGKQPVKRWIKFVFRPANGS